MEYNFFATISRMKYIERWALMRNSRNENLSEHSLEVAMIAHALCVIGNIRYDKELDAEKAALVGLYHDSSEIITGDMPTPVKYYNPEIKEAYKQVETIAEFKLLEKLPSDLRPAFEAIYKSNNTQSEKYMRKLVKVVIGSTTDTAPLLKDLARAGIETDGIFTSESLRLYKPARGFYEAILDALGISPSEALFAGDSPRDDVEGPAAAGLTTCLVDRKALGAGSSRPDFAVSSLAELAGILRTLV